jgi:hypothetical protein
MADDPFGPMAPGKRHPRSTSPAATTAEWTAVVPVPKNAPPPPEAHPRLGRPTRVFTYPDAQARLLGYVYRFDLADGAKEFRPLTYCRKAGAIALGWRWQTWPAPRPLYGLDRLHKRPNAPVLVCEGEKSADAAAELLPDHVVVTAPNGAKAAARADWSPLAGRAVTVWPDADDEGAAYAAAAVKLLAPIAATVRRVAPPDGVAHGWDAADALAAGWDVERAGALLAAAGDALAPPAKKTPATGKRRRARPVGDGDTADGAEGEPRRRLRQSGELLELIGGAEFWHSPDQEAFATIPIGGHREHWPVRSKTFKLWLAQRYFEATGGAPGAQSTEDALRVLEGTALFQGPELTPWLRIGEHERDLYLDLADGRWRAVRITCDGWSVVDEAPIKFVRSSAMLALPAPEPGETIERLHGLINVRTEGDLKMVVGWLVGAFSPRGPYPILVLNGEQGSSKSTLSRLLRHLVDPNTAPIRSPPRDEQTLVIGARNSWVCAIDNLSDLLPWLADAFCRLATGGGFSARELFTDYGEIVVHVTRPVILNGIPDVASRADLSDRSIHLKLPALPEHERRAEAEYWADVEARRPAILGALLDAVSAALRRRGELPPVLTRMADHVAWVTGAESGLGWHPGAFVEAYLANRGEAVDLTIEGDVIAESILKLAEEENWRGTPTALLLALDVPDKVRDSRSWPSPNKLKGRLERLKPVLRAKDIEIEDGKTSDRKRRRLIFIRRRDRADPADWNDPPAGV